MILCLVALMVQWLTPYPEISSLIPPNLHSFVQVILLVQNFYKEETLWIYFVLFTYRTPLQPVFASEDNELIHFSLEIHDVLHDMPANELRLIKRIKSFRGHAA